MGFARPENVLEIESRPTLFSLTALMNLDPIQVKPVLGIRQKKNLLSQFLQLPLLLCPSQHREEVEPDLK